MAHPTATLQIGHRATATLEIGHKARATLRFVESPSGFLRIEPKALLGQGRAREVGYPHAGLLSSLTVLPVDNSATQGRAQVRASGPLQSAALTPLSNSRVGIASSGQGLSGKLTSDWAPTVLRGRADSRSGLSMHRWLADASGRLTYSPIRFGGQANFRRHKSLVDATTYNDP